MHTYLPARTSMFQAVIDSSYREEYIKLLSTVTRDIHYRKPLSSESQVPLIKYFDEGSSGQKQIDVENTELLMETINWWNDVEKSDLNPSPEVNNYFYTNIDHRFNNENFEVFKIDQEDTFINAMKLIYEVYAADKDSFYGALLIRGSDVINPLHPLMAQMAAYNKQGYEGTYKIVLYIWKERRKNLLSDGGRSILFSKKYDSLFAKQLTNICTVPVFEKVKSLIPYEIISPTNPNVSQVQEFSYNCKIVNALGVATEDRHIVESHLIPVQILNDGIMSPYYGTVAVQYKDGGALGSQLTPMLSPNVGRQSIGSSGLSSASVCTGSLSRNSLEGRLSLNHGNMGSPYFEDTMSVGAHRFAEMSVEFSWGLYSELLGLGAIEYSFNLNGETPAQIPERCSFEQFKTLGIGSGSIQDFLHYIKQINEMEIQRDAR